MKKIFTFFAAAILSIASFAAEETVYFVNNMNWTTVKAYAWEPANAEWPGVAINATGEKIGNYDVYSYTAEQGKYTNVIFNNGSSNAQTADLVWSNGKYYWMGVKKGFAGGTKDEAEVAVGTPIPTYDYYVAGSFNSWVNSDPNYGMALDGDVYKVTLSLEAGEHQMKVTNGTWDNAKGYDAIDAKYEEVSKASGNDGNILITLSASKDIIVVYNATTEKITFEGLTATGTVTPTTYYVVGTFNEWNNGDAAYAMAGEGNIYKKDLTLATGAHMLKVTNGTWDNGCNWGYSNIAGAYSEVSEGTNDEGQPNGNILITLTTETIVTVVFDAEAKKISFEGLTEIESSVSYVLMGVGGDWKTGIPMTKNEKAEGEEYMLIGQTITASDSVKVVRLENEAAKHYCGNVKDDCKALVLENKVNDNIVLAPDVYDFYYDVAADAIWIAVSSSDPAAVDNVTVEKKAAKVIRNGQMYILRDGVMYNAIGQIAE